MRCLDETLGQIGELDSEMMAKARERLDSLTKPRGSLGRIEEIAIKLAGIKGVLYPGVDQKAHVLMAADHGVVEEGVSAYPQEVTTRMVYNFLNGGAAINVLAKQIGVKVTIVDIGVCGEISADGLLVRKVRKGTDNISKGPAMSREEAINSIEVGIEVVNKLINNGANLIGTGEMGIGNTTASSAIIAAITGLPLDNVVGYGTGINDIDLKRKKDVIKRALEINSPDPEDGLDVLARVGGLEIGGMAGVMLGAAARRTPVVIDGFISGAAALIAKKLNPGIVNFLLPSHKSVEPGHIFIYRELGIEPLLDLKMRLGEGTGAVLAMSLVESATRIIREMATFDEAKINI